MDYKEWDETVGGYLILNNRIDHSPMLYGRCLRLMLYVTCSSRALHLVSAGCSSMQLPRDKEKE